MITVEELLEAFSLAYDTWLDPESKRENPVPEYARLIRQAVSAENESLRELMKDMLSYYAMPNEIDYKREADLLERAHEMGVEVDA